MDETTARQVLNNMFEGMVYVSWRSEDDVILDGNYSIEELEAILWWMKNVKQPFPNQS